VKYNIRKKTLLKTIFIEEVEKYLIRAIVVGVILIVLVQTFFLQDPMQLYMSFSEKLNQEVTDFDRQYPEARATSGQVAAFSTVTIRLENFSSLQKAKLLINDSVVADFRDKQVTVRVNPHDVLSIDGSYYTHRLVFKIVSASKNVAQPKTGRMVEVYKNQVSLDPVDVSESH